MVGNLSISLLKEDGREYIEVRGSLWNPPRRKYELIQKACQRCSTPLSRNVESCFNCRSLGELDSVVAMGYYIKEKTRKERNLEPQQTSEDILRAKNNDLYSQVLGKALSVFLQKKRHELTNFDLIVPVPGSSKELEMAKEISKTTGILLTRKALVKEAGQTTYHMPPDQRRAEAKRTIHGTDNKLDGLSIILVDDVHTTSATASRCAQVLKYMGANRVIALVVGKDVTIPEVINGQIVSAFIEEMLPKIKKSSQLKKTAIPKSPGFFVGKSKSTKSLSSSLDKVSSGYYRLHCLKCGGKLVPVLPLPDSLILDSRKKEFRTLQCTECNRQIDITSIEIRIRPLMMGAGIPVYSLQCKTHRATLRVTHKFPHTTREGTKRTWFFAFGFGCSKGCKIKISKRKFGCI